MIASVKPEPPIAYRILRNPEGMGWVVQLMEPGGIWVHMGSALTRRGCSSPATAMGRSLGPRCHSHPIP